MPHKMWAIALHASEVTAAQAPNPAQIRPVAYSIVTNPPFDFASGTAPEFGDPVPLAINEVLNFTIVATPEPDDKKGPATCPVQMLPLGWPNGGCPPNLRIELADLGVSRLGDLQLPFDTADATPCHVLSCQFNGSGIFTCTGSCVTLTVDVNSYYAAPGVYITCERLETSDQPVLVSLTTPDGARTQIIL